VKSFKLAFVLFSSIALWQSNALGWGSAGHMVIAAEAFRQLSPDSKAKVYETLKAHPDFTKWTNSYHPNLNVDLATYVFMRSSTWPDDIRRSGNQYDHPNWHFIDYPLRPPSFPMEPGPKPTDDVLYGISQSEKTLNDTNAAPEARAVALSWLVHLIGDMHQPLHCVSLFTAVYPKGDKGGNDFFVKPNERGIRLHSLWDGLLGSSANPQTQWKYAVTLEGEFPKSKLPELTKDTDTKAWSLESRELAIDKGYLHGNLKGSTNADDAPSMPADYTKNAKAVAERQGALAGYRLASKIEKNLKVGQPVGALPVITSSVKNALPAKIGIFEATNYYNETMVVTGKVVQVTVRPTITFVSLDKTGPSSPFSVVIFPENNGKFPEIQTLMNKSVEISGTIIEYRNKPEIVLESPDQIKVVK
jgi:hypothetical protein